MNNWRWGLSTDSKHLLRSQWYKTVLMDGPIILTQVLVRRKTKNEYQNARALLAFLLLFLVTHNSITPIWREGRTFRTQRAPRRLPHEKHWRSTTILSLLILSSTALYWKTRKREAGMGFPCKTKVWLCFKAQHGISRRCIAASWQPDITLSNWWPLKEKQSISNSKYIYFYIQMSFSVVIQR